MQRGKRISIAASAITGNGVARIMFQEKFHQGVILC